LPSSPYINHFIQPDTIIPDPTNPQAWNTYSYVYGNPISRTDPSGHACVEGTSYCVNSNTGQTSGSLTSYNDSSTKSARLDGKIVEKKEKPEGGYYCEPSYGCWKDGATDISGTWQDPAVYISLAVGGWASGLFETSFWGTATACIGNIVCRWVTGMTGGVGSYQSVSTPYGPANQSMTPQALQARTQVQNGAQLYKMGTLGPSNGTESQFWSLENPLLNPNYAQQYGIPAQNVSSSQTFLLVGQLKEGAIFITRSAPGVGSNLGGSLEIVTQEYGVNILEYIMP
jgi:hypothetical protein